MTNLKKKNLALSTNNSAFTLVELLVSIGILLIIFAISTVALSGVIPSTSQSTVYDSLISDVRLQQTQAMTNDSYYGIHFAGTSYTLYQGTTYTPSDPSNYVVNLDPTVNFSAITFPGNNLSFSPGSGDVTGYVSGNDSLTIRNVQTGTVTQVKINRYGATY